MLKNQQGKAKRAGQSHLETLIPELSIQMLDYLDPRGKLALGCASKATLEMITPIEVWQDSLDMDQVKRALDTRITLGFRELTENGTGLGIFRKMPLLRKRQQYAGKVGLQMFAAQAEKMLRSNCLSLTPEKKQWLAKNWKKLYALLAKEEIPVDLYDPKVLSSDQLALEAQVAGFTEEDREQSWFTPFHTLLANEYNVGIQKLRSMSPAMAAALFHADNDEEKAAELLLLGCLKPHKLKAYYISALLTKLIICLTLGNTIPSDAKGYLLAPLVLVLLSAPIMYYVFSFEEKENNYPLLFTDNISNKNYSRSKCASAFFKLPHSKETQDHLKNLALIATGIMATSMIYQAVYPETRRANEILLAGCLASVAILYDMLSKHRTGACSIVTDSARLCPDRIPGHYELALVNHFSR